MDQYVPVRRCLPCQRSFPIVQLNPKLANYLRAYILWLEAGGVTYNPQAGSVATDRRCHAENVLVGATSMLPTLPYRRLCPQRNRNSATLPWGSRIG